MIRIAWQLWRLCCIVVFAGWIEIGMLVSSLISHAFFFPVIEWLMDREESEDVIKRMSRKVEHGIGNSEIWFRIGRNFDGYRPPLLGQGRVTYSFVPVFSLMASSKATDMYRNGVFF